MAITREQKEQVIARVKDALKRSKLTVLVDYRGLSVADTQALRRRLKEQAVDYTVAKNTLVKRALKDSEAFKDTDAELLAGPVALAFGFEDEVAPAQGLAKFAKDHPELEIKGAIDAAGTILTAEEVNRLAVLPSQEQLRAQVVGTIAAPLAGFANVLAGNVRGLLNVLNGAAKEA